MTDDKNLSSANNFMAVTFATLTGFAAGVTTMFLMDEKNRGQVVKMSQKVIKDIKTKASDVSGTIDDKIGENKELMSSALKKTAKNLKEGGKE